MTKSEAPTRGLVRALICGGFLAVAASAYAAPVEWTLQGVTFDDGATATGTFEYNAATNTYSNWDIDVTAGTFSAYDYLPGVDGGFAGGATASAVDFVAFAPGSRFGRFIHLVFDAPLTDLGGTLLLDVLQQGGDPRTQSFECTNCDVHRFVVDGEVTTTPSQVPEPATLALLSLGLAGLGFSRRRKMN